MNALAAVLIVGVLVSGFIWLLEGSRFTVGESAKGSRSNISLSKSFLSSPSPKLSSTSVPLSAGLAVSPPGLNPNDCTSGEKSWTCTVTLSLASASPGKLNWSAGSDLSDVIFTPSSGTLAPGQSVQVTISVPNMSPMLAISPTGFDANTDCNLDSDQDWTCVATLANNQNVHCPASFSFMGPMNTVSVSWNCTAMRLNWSASSELSDVTFTPSSGTLAPGQSVQVTIAISDVTCPATATFSFAGPRNTVDVPWSCST